jgi:integrase
MATVNFLYRSNKPEGKLTLRLLFRFEGTDYVFAGITKIETTKDYWNKYHNAQRTSDINILNTRAGLNTKINDISNYILKEFEKSNPTTISKVWLQNQINDFYNPKKDNTIPTDLVSFFDYYLEYRKNELEPPSAMKYKTIQGKLKDFQIYRKRTINLTDVNEAFMNEFIDYYKLLDHQHNTWQKEFAFIKTVCKKAKFLGLEVSHQLEALTIKPKKVESIYLTIEELDKINNTILADENFEGKLYKIKDLETAKDWLIISAYCGQRVSDFMRFKTKMIRTENNQMFIEFTQKKTDKLMTVPLHTKIIEILNKRNFSFPDMLQDQDYNKLLKVLCKQAKIENIINGGKQIGQRKVYNDYKKYELVTSHIGRRSFASNNYGIIPTSYLIYITGHSSEAMFLNYIGKSNKDIAIEVAKYFK